jgi:hypothetical protein
MLDKLIVLVFLAMIVAPAILASIPKASGDQEP